jgi:hypothetical protein
MPQTLITPYAEKTEYMTAMTRVVRTDALKRLALVHLYQDGGPILPLQSSAPDAFAASPLAALFPSDGEAATEAAAALMGPGPWTLDLSLPLPSCGSLQPSNRNKRANVLVTHALRAVLRVERGDDAAVDAKGKRKLFDIVVHTPVHLFSVRACARAPAAAD